MPTILSRRRPSTLIPDEEGCRDHIDLDLGSAVDSDSDQSHLSPNPNSLASSTLSSFHSSPIPSSAPSPSVSPSPSSTVNDQEPDPEPFVLVHHPAVVFASDRLSDSAITERFHTVNVFDFDQTLFQSPLPNPALWDPSFIGILTSWNYCGTGWWHNPGTLELGPEIEASCWEGWWNEDIVTQVKESSADPGCLTVLLTGRNGPTFGTKLIQMVTKKGLDFDLIATKPTTVSQMATTPTPSPTKSQLTNNNNNNTSSIPQSLTPASISPSKSTLVRKPTQMYQKVHTFNTKHDFLYNVLFEHPKIRTMHLWDDRPCQVAKFRQAGQEWLDKKMLDRFEMTVVQEPMLYMDPKLEKDLVLEMVEANNRQVEIERQAGPYMVPGVGLHPRTRPELRDRAIWDPYETYVPHKRLKIEVHTIVRYTGVMFSELAQDVIRDIFLGSLDPFSSSTTKPPNSNHQKPWMERPVKLRGHNLSKWVVPDDLHVTFCTGGSNVEHLEAIGGLGATAFVEVEASGQFEDRIWALKVKEFDVKAHLDRSGDNVEERPVLFLAPNGKLYPTVSSLQEAYSSNTASTSSKPQPLRNGSRSEEHQDQEAVSTETTAQLLEHVDLTRLGHVVLKKKEITPHITLVYDRLNGTRAVDSGKITEWESLQRTLIPTLYSSEVCTKEDQPVPSAGSLRLVFVGTIAQKKLLGMKSRSTGVVQTKAEVSLGNVIKSVAGEKNTLIATSGKELGEIIKAVKEEMERMGVENRLANEERISTIAQEVCDRVVNMKLVGQGQPDLSSQRQTTQQRHPQDSPPPIILQSTE
ncbi:hypothetical protein BGZ83_006117 [Gryganskiella cystojenkinii]|nr:hypothetical protein BGZ83_006117 [Gryganskiella cystojenkinii]